MKTDQMSGEVTVVEHGKVLVAGASGYAGGYVVRELLKRGIPVKALVRPGRKPEGLDGAEFAEAEVTRPETLKGICDDVQYVISTVGITRQKDGLSYMDVDYQANANLLAEAKKVSVQRFVYVSVLHGKRMRHLKICEAKERFGDALRQSGLPYTLIRPNGFFSDMGDFLKMAQSGRVLLFGSGGLKLNPIHGADLAEVIVDSLSRRDPEIPVGGPDLLSQNDIARMALAACGRPEKIIHLPDRLRRGILWLLRRLTSPKVYGPVEFFLTAMALDLSAPAYGQHRLEDFFRDAAQKK